jgi:hypothetical protein
LRQFNHAFADHGKILGGHSQRPWLEEENEGMRNAFSLNARAGGVNKNKTSF